MENDLTQDPGARTVRCRDCGETRADLPWVPGIPCPACGSARFEPVVVVSTGSDYDAADRSGGFALEDIRFGRLAVWANMISSSQLQRALFQQSRRARLGGSADDLAGVFLREKTLGRRQVNAIHAARRVDPGNTDDIEFGLMAVRLGLASEQQVTSCRKAQRQVLAAGGDVPPLPLLMCEKRILKEGQVLALLKKAEMQGKCLLFTLRRNAARPARSRKTHANLFGSLVANPTARIVAISALVLLGALFIYANVSGSSTYFATVRCEKCGAEGGMPVKSEWPSPCPQCHNKGLYPLGICLRCGERFIVKNPMGYGINCPRCGSSSFKLITNELDLAEIEASIKANSEPSGPGE